MKKAPKVLWARRCFTAEKYGGFHIAFHMRKKALRDCAVGKKHGCAGTKGNCPGPVAYDLRKKKEG